MDHCVFDLGGVHSDVRGNERLGGYALSEPAGRRRLGDDCTAAASHGRCPDDQHGGTAQPRQPRRYCCFEGEFFEVVVALVEDHVMTCREITLDLIDLRQVVLDWFASFQTPDVVQKSEAISMTTATPPKREVAPYS